MKFNKLILVATNLDSDSRDAQIDFRVRWKCKFGGL